MNDRAWFVKYPSRIDDLRRPHPVEHRVPYAVARTVTLSRIEYGNFIEDFEVERRYLERHASRCRIGEDGVWRCILVRCRRRKDGVLVMPDGKGRAVWAAYAADA